MKKEPGEQSIFQPGLAEYMAAELINRPYPFMYEMEKYAVENRIPILGVDAGAVLAFIVQGIAPLSVLELGTGLGYSTAWMISGMSGGHIITVDRNEALQLKAGEFLGELPVDVKVEFDNSLAVEYVEKNAARHDLVFVDCDKVAYPEILVHYLASGNYNYLLFDNVLWHGRLQDKRYNLPSDLSMREFWNIVKSAELEMTLFPAGDGLLLLTSREK